MSRNPNVVRTTILLAIWACSFLSPGPALSCCAQAPPGELTPANTVILANQADARFSQDFSILLKSLRLEWTVVDSAEVPDSVRDKNLILLGRLDGAYTGEIMRSLLTAEEIETVRSAAEGQIVLSKANPWAEGRRVYVCAGAGLLQTRNAAEGAVRAIMASTPPASDWIRTRFDATPDAAIRESVEQLLFSWDDAELPLADLTVDIGAKPRRRLSALQAGEDVERLFYLFSHGYSGYAFFNQQGEFAQAKARILEALTSRDQWSSAQFSRLLYEHLSFITDCHLNIGGFQYAGHLDFWYDTTLELTLGADGYQATIDGIRLTVVSVNGQDPRGFIFPSLNAQGDPVYKLGTLSKTEPAPLLVAAERDTEERLLEISLQRSDFAYHSDDLFREDEVGGIPVVRIRSFSDVPADPVNRFVETGRAYQDEPVIIVDIRGNGGGNERWPIAWIQGLTGRRAGSVFIFSELHSKTTMAGRANVFADLYERYPDMPSFQAEAEQLSSLARAFEDGTRQPGWMGPLYPPMPLIANDTTIILVMNGLVASAGEGLVMRASQAENVVLVGENTRGCLTFGNGSAHQLPHSRLPVRLPINVGLYLDQAFREEVGIAPDLWVPAADAVNYAVAALRNGTITTRQPLSPATLQQPFALEDPWARVRQETIVRYLVILSLAVGGSVWAYFLREKPRIVAGVGSVWLILGGTWVLMERPFGLGLLLAGGACLVWGGINLLRARNPRAETAP